MTSGLDSAIKSYMKTFELHLQIHTFGLLDFSAWIPGNSLEPFVNVRYRYRTKRNKDCFLLLHVWKKYFFV